MDWGKLPRRGLTHPLNRQKKTRTGIRTYMKIFKGKYQQRKSGTVREMKKYTRVLEG